MHAISYNESTNKMSLLLEQAMIAMLSVRHLSKMSTHRKSTRGIAALPCHLLTILCLNGKPYKISVTSKASSSQFVFALNLLLKKKEF